MGKKWEDTAVPEATYEDLSEEAIDFFKKKAKERGRLGEKELEVDNLTLLQKLGLYNGLYFNKATMLLFAKDPCKWVLNSYIKIGFFKSNNADLIYQDEIREPIIMQIEKAIDLIYLKYMKALIRYEGVSRVEEYLISPEAFREILLNSINHKRYEEQNPIQVSIYDDKIYVYNDALFPKDLAETNLYEKHNSKPYNPLIANVFFLAGFIESWGRGFEKIKEECKKTNTPLPKVKVTSGGVMIYCTPSEKYMKSLQQLGGYRRDTENDKINDKIKMLLDALKSNPKATIPELSQKTSISPASVSRYLKQLQEEKIIQRVGSNKTGYWQILV